MAVRDFFQKEEVEEEEDEVEAVEELTVDGRSLRDEEEEEEEKEGLSRGLLRGCSVAAGDGEGSGRERRRRAEGSRESALWSVTMSRARAASPASPPRWSPPPPWWWGKRDDIAGGAWALGWVGGFLGGDLKRAARPATWGRRTDTAKGERSGAGGALLWWCVLFCCRYWYSTGRARVGDADALCFGGARRAALARCFVCELDLGSPSSRSKAGRKEFPSRES